jgi:hypothetical protein
MLIIFFSIVPSVFFILLMTAFDWVWTNKSKDC